MSTQVYNPIDNRAFRGTTVDVQPSTMNNGMGGSHLKLNQPKHASKALLGSATKAAKFGKVLGPAGTILNAGVSIATADKSQGAAGIAGDVFAETGGYMLGAAKGAAIGSFLGPIGTAVGGVTGGLIGGGVASWGMDQVQNLWRQNTSSNDSTKYRNSPAPTSNPNGIPQTGTATTTRGFADLRGSITPGSSDAAPTNNGAVLANAGADQWQQNKKSAGKDITKAEVPVLNKSYGSMSREEINEAYDRMRYGDNFDKARESMGKAKGNPFDSTNNPEKFLVDPAGQKKAVEQGLEMHKSFFAQGGGRSRELNGTSPTSSSRQSSPAAKPNEPGSGVRSERLGTFVSAHDKHINFSGKQQKNSPGSGQPGGRTVKDVFSRAVHPPSSSSRNKPGSGKRNNAVGKANSYLKGNSASGSSLSKDEKYDLSLLRRFESDGSGGYEAVNQFGFADGHQNYWENPNTGKRSYVGAFSKMPQHGGRKLTDMSVQEIMDLQSNNNMSHEEWANSGRLHAVGAYQFIGSTFASEVARQGIDLNAKFTSDVQDRMGLNYLKHTGDISKWVGTNDLSDEEKAYLNKKYSRS